MNKETTSSDDSARKYGGSIPGTADHAAFSLLAPQPSALPILIAVPHAGRAYPAELIAQMRNPGYAAPRLEDRYADRLGERVAAATGATLLVAQAPRAMIDLNRSLDDVDWDMFTPNRPNHAAPGTPGLRARSGLGLVPRRLPGLGELWKQRHDAADLRARIAGIHQPYHACLAQALDALRARWGAALLIDLHSMPPLGLRGPQPSPEFVIGDRFGASCHGQLIAASFGYFSVSQRHAAHNRPYAGGFVLDHHAAPDRGRHALQLEVDRTCYLDRRLAEPGPGFDATVDLLTGLVLLLASVVAALGGQQGTGPWAEAAE